MSPAAEDPGGDRPAILTGATGLVGLELLPLLLHHSFVVRALSRRPRRASGEGPPGPGRVTWLEADLSSPPVRGAGLPPAECFLHAAPIWLLPTWVPAAADAGVRRLVAVSSTSRFTKRESSSPPERELARRLAEAEEAVMKACGERAIRWTIFRPTLIYGRGRDRNVGDIARVLRRTGVFPVAGRGAGLRQPVHAADVAAACLAALDRPATFDRAYELPGGETLSYAEMVSRIARGVGRTPRVLHVPLPLLRAALAVARRLPGLAHLTPDVADRMNTDLVFDAGAARRDFGYDPRPFLFPDGASVTDSRDEPTALPRRRR